MYYACLKCALLFILSLSPVEHSHGTILAYISNGCSASFPTIPGAPDSVCEPSWSYQLGLVMFLQGECAVNTDICSHASIGCSWGFAGGGVRQSHSCQVTSAIFFLSSGKSRSVTEWCPLETWGWSKIYWQENSSKYFAHISSLFLSIMLWSTTVVHLPLLVSRYYCNKRSCK